MLRIFRKSFIETKEGMTYLSLIQSEKYRAAHELLIHEREDSVSVVCQLVCKLSCKDISIIKDILTSTYSSSAVRAGLGECVFRGWNGEKIDSDFYIAVSSAKSATQKQVLCDMYKSACVNVTHRSLFEICKTIADVASPSTRMLLNPLLFTQYTSLAESSDDFFNLFHCLALLPGKEACAAASRCIPRFVENSLTRDSVKCEASDTIIDSLLKVTHFDHSQRSLSSCVEIASNYLELDTTLAALSKAQDENYTTGGSKYLIEALLATSNTTAYQFAVYWLASDHVDFSEKSVSLLLQYENLIEDRISSAFTVQLLWKAKKLPCGGPCARQFFTALTPFPPSKRFRECIYGLIMQYLEEESSYIVESLSGCGLKEICHCLVKEEAGSDLWKRAFSCIVTFLSKLSFRRNSYADIPCILLQLLNETFISYASKLIYHVVTSCVRDRDEQHIGDHTITLWSKMKGLSKESVGQLLRNLRKVIIDLEVDEEADLAKTRAQNILCLPSAGCFNVLIDLLTEDTSEEMVGEIVDTIICLTQANAECRSQLSRTSPDVIIWHIFHSKVRCTDFIISTAMKLVYETSESNELVIQNDEYLIPILRHSMEDNNSTNFFLSTLSSCLQLSRHSCLKISSSGFLNTLLELFPKYFSSEPMKNCIIHAMKESVDSKQLKHFVLSPMRAEKENRPVIAASILEVLSGSCNASFKDQQEPRFFLNFLPQVGHSGLEISIDPQQGCEGISLDFSARVEKFKRRSVLVGISAKQTATVSVIFENGNICLHVANLRTNSSMIHRLNFEVSRDKWHSYTVSIKNAAMLSPSIVEIFVDKQSIGRAEFRDIGGLPLKVVLGNHPTVSSRKSYHEALFGSVGRVSIYKTFVSPLTEVWDNKSNLLAVVDPRTSRSGDRIIIGSSDVTSTTFEASVLCSIKPALQSVLDIGCVDTVLIPLTILTVNATLPFQQLQYAILTERSSEACIQNILQLLLALTSAESARKEMMEKGFFTIFSEVMKVHSASFTHSVFLRLFTLANAFVLIGSLFDTFAQNIILDLSLLEIVPPTTQLSFVACLLEFVTNAEGRKRLRKLGLIRYISSAVTVSFYEESTHNKSIRDQLFRILEVVLKDIITASETYDLTMMVACALRRNTILGKEIFFFSRSFFTSSHLINQLGRTDYARILIELMKWEEEVIRVEAIRQFGKLLLKSQRTQEIFNPKLLLGNFTGESYNTRHTIGDVSLTFLATLFRNHGISEAVYDALMEVTLSRVSMGKQSRTKLVLPNLIPPILIAAEASSNELRSRVLEDLMSILSSDSLAWNGIIALPCWYVHVVETILSEEDLDKWIDRGPILFFIFSKALRSCTFFDSELRMIFTYLSIQEDTRAHNIKSWLMKSLIQDAMLCDPSSLLQRSNKVALIVLCEEAILQETFDGDVMIAYFGLIGTADMASHLFMNSDNIDSATGFLKILGQASVKVPLPRLIDVVDRVVDIGCSIFPMGFFRKSQPLVLFVSACLATILPRSGNIAAIELCKKHRKLLNLKTIHIPSLFFGSEEWGEIYKQGSVHVDALNPRIKSQDEARSELHTLVASYNLAKEALQSEINNSLEVMIRESFVKKFEGPARRLVKNKWLDFLLTRSFRTIWQPPVSEKYVCLSDKEQGLLCGMKLKFDPDGTDHHEVSAQGRCADHLVKTEVVRVKKGEMDEVAVFAESDEESSEEEEDTLKEGDKERLRDFNVICEVVHYMHCWSARLKLMGGILELEVDANNTAVNQTVSNKAEIFLSSPPSKSWSVDSIDQLFTCRRYRMQRTAVQFKFTDQSILLINFTSQSILKSVVSKIEASSKSIRLDEASPSYTLRVEKYENPRKQLLKSKSTERWRNREISNFEYLISLNFNASRSTRDLTQYPVFPWVLTDYTSSVLDINNPQIYRDLRLPVGLLGKPERAKEVEDRYKEMKGFGDVPFHFFTHYSNAAVVLYYLLRLEPYTTFQILFQGGKFDHADRLFHSVSSTFSGVSKNIQDVKELIPEFYYLPEAFINHNNVAFGSKQDGSDISELALPPWANGCPYQFVYLMRSALESEHVSANLHHWINLIFGYQQRGPKAVESLNLFHPHTYENERNKHEPVCIDVINSLDNIGQTPIQLFTTRHPERNLVFPEPITSELFDLVMRDIPQPPAALKGVSVSHMRFFGDKLVVVRQDGSVTSHRYVSGPFLVNKSSTVIDMFRAEHNSSFIVEAPEMVLRPLSGLVDGANHHFSTIVSVGKSCYVAQGGLLNNDIVLRLVSSGRQRSKVINSHTDIITHVVSDTEGKYVVSAGLDTVIHVWIADETSILKLHSSIYSHDTEIVDVAVSSVLDTVASCGSDGIILFHSIASKTFERRLEHPNKRRFTSIVFADDAYVRCLIAHSDSDNTTRLYSVNGVPFNTIVHPYKLFAISPMPRQQSVVISTSNGVEVRNIFTWKLERIVRTVDRFSTFCGHPFNPQVIIGGCDNGDVKLFRFEPNQQGEAK